MKDTESSHPHEFPSSQLEEYESLVEIVSLLLSTPNVTLRVQEICNNILEKYLIRMHTKWL